MPRSTNHSAKRRRLLSKTFIPFSDWVGLGGPHTFMGNLASWLRREKLDHSSEFAGADTVFFPVRYDIERLYWAKLNGKKIVVRLDGVWYPQKHGDAHEALNRNIREIYSHLADFVVFQSDYCRRQCFEVFGEIDVDRYSIIVNGASLDTFSPDPARGFDRSMVRLITTGNFRDRAMLEPVVLALDALAKTETFTLEVVGPVKEPLTDLLQRDYIIEAGSLESPQIAERLRASDIFIYSHLNPPCPNSVIEAVSCGLPVVGFDSGAMKELLPWSDQLLAPVSGNVLQTYDEFDPARLADKVKLAIDTYEDCRHAALKHSRQYPFDGCAEAYVDVLSKVTTSPARMAATKSARLVTGPVGRMGMRAGSRVGIRSAVTSIALEVLARSSKAEFRKFIVGAVRMRSERLPAPESLRELFELGKGLYELEGTESIRYGGGVHTKHRHIRYHDFFLARVRPGDRVLDLGCGKGELGAELAMADPSGSVIGIDRKQSSIDWARGRFGTIPNISFVLGDITESLPDERFDAIVLSNVLEHIDSRTAFLRELNTRFTPRSILIRVPVYQRDWRVPLMDELGVDYRLDREHTIEYTQESFAEELKEAGLVIVHQELRWGEIWAEAAAE